MAQHPTGAAQHRRMAQTWDGYTFYENQDGTWTDTPEPQNCDMRYDSLDDLFAQDPELLIDGRPYSDLAAQRERAVGGTTPLRRPKPR